MWQLKGDRCWKINGMGHRYLLTWLLENATHLPQTFVDEARYSLDTDIRLVRLDDLTSDEWLHVLQGVTAARAALWQRLRAEGAQGNLSSEDETFLSSMLERLAALERLMMEDERYKRDDANTR